MYAIIDIGSNSMRLTVYKIKDNKFKILFKEKSMAGLASYVENGCLNQDGITRACEGLLDFKNTLEMLGLLDRVYVFATASLRNIVNTDDAVAKITAATGFPIDVISGQEEAMLGYIGMMQQYPVTSGAAIDIGGASTELSVFANQAIVFSKSYRVGSLKLYKDCVKNILPGDGSVKRIKHAIQKEFPTELFASFYPQKCMVCTGGTARSVLKVAKQQGIVANDCQQISMQQLVRASTSVFLAVAVAQNIWQ